MRKVFKFVKGKKEGQKEVGAGITPSQSRDLSSPAQTPEDERFLSLDSSGYIVDFCGKDKTLTKLHKAAWQGHLEKLKSALKKIEIDSVDRHNRSALHFAVAQGHPNIVWYLLGNNAKMTICDDDGCTPLLKAVECGHKDCMSLLLERGADVNNADYQGNTGLHIAAKQGTLDIASSLISRGASIDVANNCGEYPLHIATRSQNKDLVELLLRSRASVNVFDRENRTPLMLAAKTGNVLLAHLFFEYGAQLAVVDSNGWTAEDYALLNGHESVANELKSYMRTSSPKPKLETHDEEDESGTWNCDSTSQAKSPSTGKMDKAKETEDDMSDSPESEAMPPPCQPPRSWEMIQAGMIDANQEGNESKRRSITTLGTLHSRRASFTEGNNAHGQPAKYTLSLNRRKHVNRENSFARQRLSFNEEESLRSWISDTSSTLKEIEKMELDRIRDSEGKSVKVSGGSSSDWDSDSTSTSGVLHVRPGPASDSGDRDDSTCRTEAFNGIDEMWVTHAQTSAADEESGHSCWDSESSEAIFPPPPTGIELGVNMARSIGYMKGISIDHPVGDVLERNVWKNSYDAQIHSMDRFEEKGKNGIAKGERPLQGSRRHARHQSISTQKWRSEEIPQNQKSGDRLIDVNRRINEQLQCYDQALRELAETPYAKKQEIIVSTLEKPSQANNYYSLPASKHRTREESDGRYYYERSKPMTDGSGPMSLPFSVNNVASGEGVRRGKDQEDGEEDEDEDGRKQDDGAKKSKRHMLLAMRDVKHAVHVANTFKTSLDDQILSPLRKPPDSSDSDESAKDGEQHFFKSDFNVSGRQETVIERPEHRRKSSSSGTGEEPTLWLQEEKRKNSEEEVPELAAEKNDLSPGGGPQPMHEATASPQRISPAKIRGGEEEQDRQQDVGSPDVSFSSGPIEPIGGEKDSGSEADSTHNEISPTHKYTLQTHHEWLKNHLKTTTTEKNKLEQVAVELSERAERLQYELADAKEATKSKDEVILLLQSQLSRMESAYTKSLEESVQSRLLLTTHEQEILHLKELCFRYEEEKEKAGGEPDENERAELKSKIRVLEEEKEKLTRDILRLEQEKSALEKRLQEAATSEILDQCQRWKERFENLEEAAKANDEAQNAYINYVKTIRDEHVEREKKLSERNEDLEKILTETREKNSELDSKLRFVSNELESEKLRKSLAREMTGSFAEMTERSELMESQIKKLEREIEERNLGVIREKEAEMQELIKQFAIERETLVKSYETRLRDRKSSEGESWRRENEKLKTTVRQLQEQFANLQVRSSLEEINEGLRKELNAVKEECKALSNSIVENQKRGKEEVDSLMRENLNLKKEINELKIKLLKDDREEPNLKQDLLKVVSDHTIVKSEMIELKSQLEGLESTLTKERKLLEEYREKNAGLEQQIMRITADAKQSQKPEEAKHRRRGAGREDEIAWTNLYGIKRAGRGREGSVSMDDFFVGPKCEVAGGKRPGHVRSDSLVLDREVERGRDELRRRIDSNIRAEEERKGKQMEGSCQYLELKRQIILLESRMAEEKSVRCSLERKLVEMEADIREKERLEQEVNSLRRKLEKDFVPRTEIDLFRHERDLEEEKRLRWSRREEETDRSGEYRAKCERFAREMEKSKEIRKRMEINGNEFGAVTQRTKSTENRERNRSEPAEVTVSSVRLPSRSADLEPEIKFKLNEELEKSIRKHLTDVGLMTEAQTEMIRKKLLQ